jgi:hypothetical protein
MLVRQPQRGSLGGRLTSHDARWRQEARRRIRVTLAVRRAEAATGRPAAPGGAANDHGSAPHDHGDDAVAAVPGASGAVVVAVVADSAERGAVVVAVAAGSAESGVAEVELRQQRHREQQRAA